jgi:hypothetical protein
VKGPLLYFVGGWKLPWEDVSGSLNRSKINAWEDMGAFSRVYMMCVRARGQQWITIESPYVCVEKLPILPKFDQPPTSIDPSIFFRAGRCGRNHLSSHHPPDNPPIEVLPKWHRWFAIVWREFAKTLASEIRKFLHDVGCCCARVRGFSRARIEFAAGARRVRAPVISIDMATSKALCAYRCKTLVPSQSLAHPSTIIDEFHDSNPLQTLSKLSQTLAEQKSFTRPAQLFKSDGVNSAPLLYPNAENGFLKNHFTTRPRSPRVRCSRRSRRALQEVDSRGGTTLGFWVRPRSTAADSVDEACQRRQRQREDTAGPSQPESECGRTKRLGSPAVLDFESLKFSRVKFRAAP